MFIYILHVHIVQCAIWTAGPNGSSDQIATIICFVLFWKRLRKLMKREINVGKKAKISEDFMIIARIESFILGKGINDAIKRIYNFVWGDYCDWYIEFSKSKIYGPSEIERKKVLSIAVYVLKNILKLLHPFAPFITEEIWSFFDKNNFLAKSSYTFS